jgi:hypothetical protein
MIISDPDSWTAAFERTRQRYGREFPLEVHDTFD